MNRRWICSDVWMDILPSFDHAQLGLKMALLSDRFDALVDMHFDGKSELTIWSPIKTYEGIGSKAKLSVRIDGKLPRFSTITGKLVGFPLPDRPLPNNLRFKRLHIDYIDHSVLAFLRANKRIWDRSGTNLELIDTDDEQPIWDVLAREIWPIFATNVRCLSFADDNQFDPLCRRISPTFLTDLDQLISIDVDYLFLNGIADDEPDATSSAGQVLSEWLHTPTKNGQPKRLFCTEFDVDWLFSFKETFIHATASACYKICFALWPTTPIDPFELVNERTKEKMTLSKDYNFWLLKRCPISEKATADQWENDQYWDDKLNKVKFSLCDGGTGNCIGPLSPPAEEEDKEEADESNEN